MTRFRTLDGPSSAPPSRPSLRRRSHRLLWAAAVAVGALVGVGLLWQHGEEKKHAFRIATEIPSDPDGFADALHQSLGIESKPGHEVRFVANGAVFEAIVDDVLHAKESVNVDVFIWQKGTASDELISALAHRPPGVACRVLADDVGSPHFEDDIAPPLRAAGCDARIFRREVGTPDEAARDHRKIVVVDGRVAYAGGFGIRDEWLGDGVTNEGWRDENVRFTGPAVRDAQRAIAQNWQEAGGALFPASAFPPDEVAPAGAMRAAFLGSTAHPVVSRAERLVQLVFVSAKKRLWVANAYFVPSEAMLEIFEEKARAGVDVRLLVPGKKNDSRISMGSQHIAYGRLRRAGVQVFEYQPSMMHAKTVLADDALAVVGSINLEPLSMSKLEEDALVVQDRGFADELARRFEADCTHARRVTSDGDP